MNTFDVLQTLFAGDLLELQKLRKRGWFVLPMTRTVTEEHLGRCCYLAEEFLNPTDLCTFKLQMGLNEGEWRAYKARLAEQ